MYVRFVALFALVGLCSLLPAQRLAAEKKTPVQDAEKPVLRIGAVAYAPSAVTVFDGVRRYFAKNEMPIDYVLYSNYDALVKALWDGQVDVAWNTPLAHAQYHLLAGGQSQTLVMRDVDCGCRCTLVVRKAAGVNGLDGLKGKTLVLGSRHAAEATVLPIYYLKKEGVDFAKLKVLDLDKELDLRGNPCCSPTHVLKALDAGRADAGVIGESMWKALLARRAPEADKLKAIWTSPAFSHCVFTAAKGFDKKLAARFTRLMLAMDGKDSLTSEVMELEGCKKWVAGGPDGFVDLVKALQEDSRQAADAKK